MPSILEAVLVAAIFGLAKSISAQTVPTASATNSPKAVQTLGCYSSLDSSFVDQGSYTYQTSGYCQIVCSNLFKNVMATSQGSDCWCGDHIPAQVDSVSNSTCNSPCNGYDQEYCGGDTTYTVYLTGMSTDVDVDGSSSSSAAPTTTSKGPSSSSSQSPSVITKAGQTIVVTASSTAGGQSNHGGSSKVGVAVGVVVGVLAIAAIVGGLIFFMKQRKRKAVEEEYKRNAATAEFLRQKTGKSETSSTTDNRLDQAATFTHRRQSIGSIADENDFSRRILQVRNPDSV